MLHSEFSGNQRQQLLSLARQSIREGLDHSRSLVVNVEDYDEELNELGACFVTLTIEGQLRGCIGTLEAREPLVEAIAYYAYSAAFSDSRFAKLTDSEFDLIRIEISVLSPMQPLSVDSEQQLIEALNPGIDGLWIEEGRKKATFLPQVWDKLATPKNFVEQLKLKAGMASGYWSSSIKCFIYTVISIEE